MKRRYVFSETEVRFWRNGGTFLVKWRYVFGETEVRFYPKASTFQWKN